MGRRDDCVGELGEQQKNYLRFNITLVDFHVYYHCFCVMSIFFGFRLEEM
jgi:hypothetical protein